MSTTSDIATDLTDEQGTPRSHVWTWPLRQNRGQPGDLLDGAVLAALRRGLGQEAGTVPELWPYYRELRPDGRLTNRLQAEHLTLSLFGVHQQSKTQPMHRRRVELGQAMAALRDSGKFSSDAVDRRFVTFATATSLDEIETHLRGLITQLRSLPDTTGALDYDSLFDDLIGWQQPAWRGGVQRGWASRYFAKPASTDSTLKEI